MDRHDPRRSVVAVTADDDSFGPTRRRGLELAEGEGAELILYDWQAPMLLGDPLPSIWSADGSDTDVPDRLDAEALEAAGRAEIARQVRAGTRAGVKTSGWLPSNKGADALLRYATDHHAIAVVVPEDFDDIDALRVASSDGEAPRIVTV